MVRKKLKIARSLTSREGVCLPFSFFYEGWASRGTSEVVLGCRKREGESWMKEYQLYVPWGFYAPLPTPSLNGKLGYSNPSPS